MSKIYVMRHGQTERNKINHVLGRSNVSLNETGQSQANEAGKNLSSIHFDRIIASPMKRTVETAQAVAAHQKNPAAIQTDNRLIEQNFGVWENTYRLDPVYQTEKRQYFMPFKNGESILDVAARIYPFLDELISTIDPEKDENILLVTHGGICRIIANYFEPMENDPFITYFHENCQAKAFDPAAVHRDTLEPLPVTEETGSVQ